MSLSATQPEGVGPARTTWLPLLAITAVLGAWALVTSWVLERPLSDPEGSFLGPSWVRLPLLCGAAILADLLPRALWESRLRVREMPASVRRRVRSHWTRGRLLVVVLGVACFYVVYVSYRNLKSLLPLVIESTYDRELHLVDRALSFGSDPADLLHGLLGTGVSAHVLSTVYLVYIPLVAVLVTVWLVWSRDLRHAWWFVVAQAVAWTLGTVSYWALPTLGPGLEYHYLYTDLARTGTTDLMYSLQDARHRFLWGGGEAQGVAGFASLHTAISLLWALMASATVRSRGVRIAFWVNFALTVVATIYFGWHYLADDVGGVVIALVAFYVGGRLTGHRFDRHRNATSLPAARTSPEARQPVAR